MHVNEILKAAMDRQATDLHLKVGSHPVIRVEGRLQPMLDMKRLQPEDTLGAAFSLMTARQKEKFKQNLEIDLAYSVPGLGRFRCNVFQQRGSVGLVLRVIPVKVLSFDELGLPAVMEQIAEERSGLVLFAGTTGSGKSTALAAVIEHVNSTRSGHIVTIEDPIEFLHRDKKSLVNQREVDVDTRSIASALRSALRQDPDIVLVGELRDPEVIDLALTAAESGRLVLSTMSTLDAVETIGRFVGVFPADQQKHVRLQLAGVLKAIVSMRLAPRADGRGRVPTAEVLRMTPFVRDQFQTVEENVVQPAVKRIPSHVRYLELRTLWHDQLHVTRYPAKPLRGLMFQPTRRHQLHADADTEEGLAPNLNFLLQHIPHARQAF